MWATRICLIASVLVCALGPLPLGLLPFGLLPLGPAAAAESLPRAASSEEPIAAPVRGLRPLPGAIVRVFDPPEHPWLAGHRGLDITGDIGEEVLAPGPGRVRFAGEVAGTPVVSIDHGHGLISTYQPVVAVVVVGDSVGAGDVIGTVSAGGHCSRPCVHVGVKQEGVYRHPFLALRIWPRLLPW